MSTNALPAPIVHLPTVRVVNLRPQAKGSLRAFVDLELTRFGLVVRDCTWHRQTDGREWIGLPSKPYQGGDGVTRWKPIVELASIASEARQRFQEAVLAAIRAVAAIDVDAAP
jgi:DNA-binding cell septation regulator SpoVG